MLGVIEYLLDCASVRYSPLSPDHPAALFVSLLQTCWRQKFKATFAFVVIGAAALGVWYVAPRAYESEARLFVRVGRETVALDPTATVGQTIGMQESRETEINSLMEVLKSRSLHEVVVDEIGVGQVLGASPEAADAIASQKDKSTWSLVSLPSVTPGADVAPDAALRERAVSQVGNALSVTSPRRSTVISITAEASSPQLAQSMVRSLVDAYNKEHIRLHRVPGSFDFFTERAARSEENVQAALKALNEAKSELSIATVQGRRDNLEKQISALDEQSQSIAADLDSANAKVASLQKLMQEMPAEIEGVQTTGFNNDVHTRMREQLFMLEIRERELLSKYREGHPAVVAHRKQVDEARSIFADQPTNRTQQEMLPNPALRAVELDHVKGRSDLAALEAKAKAVSQQKLDVAEDLRELHHNELRIADLERELEERKTAHFEATTRLEQARINHEMENNRLSNISVIQEATLVEKPAAPRLSIFAAAGFLAACFGAVGLALGWEMVFPPKKRLAPIS
jgi:uncharacterized protein involved in exopolysaccharide biosynthesis